MQLRRRIERQSNIVLRLKEDGVDTTEAEELLEQFEWSLQTTMADRALILRLLRSQAE